MIGSMVTPQSIGRVIDLSAADVRLPARLVVDTNLIVTHLLTGYHTPFPEATERADRFFFLLQTQSVVGLVTQTIWTEVAHFALAAAFRRAVPQYREELARMLPAKRRPDWRDLYKVRPDLIVAFLPGITRLREAILLSGLTFLQVDDLRPIPSSRPFEVAIAYLMGRYWLDTSDIAILLDAQRAGVVSVATMDRDFRRAHLDFDIYTWLA